MSLVVDRKGLAGKLGNRPKAFILYELIQNAWDEPGVTTVTVRAEMLAGRPICQILVEDDSPEGFQDLSSVYTLFKDSKKAPDPTKRGRFELGEKLVAAVALRMEVVTTKGTIVIEGDERTHLRKKLERGSAVLVDIRMTRAEFDEMVASARQLIPPSGITTTFNGEALTTRTPLHTFEATLQTIRSDAEGKLVPTSRKAEVHVHEPLPGEQAMIYEMGIPIIETGDRWHYDVQQRVPVNWERNSVPPSYLKTLRVEVLNALHDKLERSEATATWVSGALEDERVEADAVKTIVTQRFGERTVIADPSDPEGTKIAMSQGYTVIPGGALSKGAWDNVRRFNTTRPAGQITPSPKPYDIGGRPENVLNRDKWSKDMWRIAEFAEGLFRKLFDRDCVVYIVSEPHVGWTANFGDDGLLLGPKLCLNYGRLGARWFARRKRDTEVLDLLLHEFVHFKVHDHLSNQMHEEATRIGAKLANLCLDEPEFFREDGR